MRHCLARFDRECSHVDVERGAFGKRTRAGRSGPAARKRWRPSARTTILGLLNGVSSRDVSRRDLRPGDLLLKFNAGSATSKIIALGQASRGQLNPEVVHVD